MHWHSTIALTSFLTVEILSGICVVQGVPNAASNFPLHLALGIHQVCYPCQGLRVNKYNKN